MFQSFELAARAGADFLAIESTGGKELHDEAILNADLPLSAFSLGILAARDMAWLWEKIVAVCRETGAVPSGDSACGFANTAMVLADQGEIPRVWAAVLRVMTVARSLVAFEQGAVGPGKDCAYEGVYTKAITSPVSLEGAEAACAHLYPHRQHRQSRRRPLEQRVGPERPAPGRPRADGLAEQLAYATRLMNAAAAWGPPAPGCGTGTTSPTLPLIRRPMFCGRTSPSGSRGKCVKEPTPYLPNKGRLVRFRQIAPGGGRRHSPSLQARTKMARPPVGQADNLPEDEREFIAGMLEQINRIRSKSSKTAAGL